MHRCRVTLPLHKNSLESPVFLFTPPFTQLNTPYPATAYLKGFLNTKGIPSVQADLGIDVILRMFSRNGLTDIFAIAKQASNISSNSARILAMQSEYISTIDSVISFLQGKNPTLALQIAGEDYLPEASRFNQLAELDTVFGSMGIQDKAKHLATLYLEDLSDLIVELIDPEFGFSRYAERLGRSANSFDELYQSLQQPLSYTDGILIDILRERIGTIKPKLVLISVPFPGNLFAAFRCGQWLKQNHPEIRVAMGGGFANTELRSLSDSRVFEFFDFISLDDGELPVEELWLNISNPDRNIYKRTFICENGRVVYMNNSDRNDYRLSETATPDYSGLPLDKYISVIEVANPMHRMWSDGRWNKLTMAHGCYWGKCTFCDISLDYIKVYEPIAAGVLCDRIEELVRTTGETGFHFVDEAAPPALMRALALEILRRGISITWWTNIRFEKSFSADLCRLLRASGCVAVSGGLEVASDRLLSLIDKGVTVGQVARVTRNFTEAGIMVHAYLMYGYPSQTVQETIDSLEMVRQLFESGVLQSGYWHQFAMTAHSPVGQNPDYFGVEPISLPGTFANNDVLFRDKTGIDHDKFSFGLKKSLFNFMHGMCFDYPLQDWFDFRIPKTNVPRDFIAVELANHEELPKTSSKVVFIGNPPMKRNFSKAKRGRTIEGIELIFHGKREQVVIRTDDELSDKIDLIIEKTNIRNKKLATLSEIATVFDDAEDFLRFQHSKQFSQLRQAGLLIL